MYPRQIDHSQYGFVALLQTVSVFGHNEATCKFVGPSQRVEQEVGKAADVTRQQELEDRVKREKLMKALAEQKLKVWIAGCHMNMLNVCLTVSPCLLFRVM